MNASNYYVDNIEKYISVNDPIPPRMGDDDILTIIGI